MVICIIADKQQICVQDARTIYAFCVGQAYGYIPAAARQYQYADLLFSSGRFDYSIAASQRVCEDRAHVVPDGGCFITGLLWIRYNPGVI